MRRREFLKTSCTIAAAATLPATVTSAVAFAAPSDEGGPRVVLPINRNWRYHPSKVAGAEAVAFDDAKFERVVIPHTNVTMPWHNFDDHMYEFISTYRRRFKYPAAAKGKPRGGASDLEHTAGAARAARVSRRRGPDLARTGHIATVTVLTSV